MAFWRVDNSFGTFLPADPTFGVNGRPYELRRIIFGLPDVPPPNGSQNLASQTSPAHSQSERSSTVSGRRFEAVARFDRIWWNKGSSSKKKISIWRPVVPQGMVYFGDVAVGGYV